MIRRNALVAAAALLIVFIVGFQARPAALADAPRDGVFIHLSSPASDAHAVLMALKMAALMAEDRDVLVYVDLKGVEVLLTATADITHPTFDSSRTQIKALLEKGVPIYVCPSCLKAAGKDPSDLLPGVKTAEKAAFFSFTKGRILTLDY